FAGIWFSHDRAETRSLVAYPTAPRAQYAVIVGSRVIVASNYHTQLYYTTDLTNLNVWFAGPTHGVFLGGGGCQARSDTLAAFGGSTSSVDGKPVIVFTHDGSSIVRTVTLSSSAGTYARSACCGRVGNRDIWLFATDANELWWTDDDGQSMHLCPDAMRVNDIAFNGQRFILVGSVSGLAFIGLSDDGTSIVRASSFPFQGDVDSVGAFDRPDTEVSGAKIPLSDVIAWIHERANIPASKYDVTQLTDMVEGVVFADSYTCADAIRSQMGQYFFDAGEFDAGAGYRINYVKRGGSASVTLTDSDVVDGPDD